MQVTAVDSVVSIVGFFSSTIKILGVSAEGMVVDWRGERRGAQIKKTGV